MSYMSSNTLSVFLCVFFFFLYFWLVCGTILVLITWTINRWRVAECDPEWPSHGSTLLTLLLWWPVAPVALVSSKISWGSRNPSTPVNFDQLDQKRYTPNGKMPGLLPFSKSTFEIISFAIRYQLHQDVQKRNDMDPLLMLKRVVVTRSFQAMIRRRGSAGLRVKSQSAIGRAAIGCGPRSLPSLYVQH